MKSIHAAAFTLTIALLSGCSQTPVRVEVSLPEKTFEVAQEIPLTLSISPIREPSVDIGDNFIVIWSGKLTLYSPNGRSIYGHQTSPERPNSPLAWYPATKAKPLVKVFELSSLFRGWARPWERAFNGDEVGVYRVLYEGTIYVRSTQNTNQVWSGKIRSNELTFELKPPSPASIQAAFHTLSDKNAATESKLRAIEVLKLRRDEAVVSTMTNLVVGTNTVVGLAALGILDRIRSPELFDIFVSCLMRPDKGMQCFAFWTIDEYPESQRKMLTKVLTEEYKRGPARMSWFALRALARFGDESALPILEEIATKYNDEFIHRDAQKRVNRIKAQQRERQLQTP
ncbi:MAG: hypothetical protein WC740_09285 [Verrucomicrobiia bacterium]